MQILWPWCVFEIGVILTFAALLGIGLGAQLGDGRPLRSYLWVTVAAWICTSLVVVLWSGSFSVVSLVLNFVLAGPWSMLNCTAGLLGLALLLANVPGGGLMLQLVSWVNVQLTEVLIALRDLPFMSFVLQGAWLGGVAAALGIALVTLLVRCGLRWCRR
jgi:hypothetical protein